MGAMCATFICQLSASVCRLRVSPTMMSCIYCLLPVWKPVKTLRCVHRPARTTRSVSAIFDSIWRLCKRGRPEWRIFFSLRTSEAWWSVISRILAEVRSLSAEHAKLSLEFYKHFLSVSVVGKEERNLLIVWYAFVGSWKFWISL